MDVKHKLLMLVFDLVRPLAVGYALARQHRFRMPSVRKMMTANIMVVAPVMALMSLWAVALEAQLIWLPFLGVAMQATAGGIGMLRARAKYDGPLDRGSFILSAMLSNRGIVGTITVFLLFGEAGFAYGQLIMLLASFVLYGFCFPMAHYYRRAYEPDPARPISLRAMFFTRNQFALVGIAIGLTLNLAGLLKTTGFPI